MDLKETILKRYKSVYAFANAIGWSQQRAWQFVNRDPKRMNLSKLREICDFLEVDLKELI